MAGLQLLAALVEAGKPASQVLRLFEPVPQILKNVRLGIDQAADAVLTQANVREAIEAAESALNGKGRLLIRPSGTEPLIRVMAEGDDQAAVEAIVDRVVDALESVAA